MVEGGPRCNRCKASKKGCDRQQPICSRCHDAGLKESDCIPEDIALVSSRRKRRSTLSSGSMTSSIPVKRPYGKTLPTRSAQFSKKEIKFADNLIHALEMRSDVAQDPRKKKPKPATPDSPQESVDTMALSSRTVSVEPTRSACGNPFTPFEDLNRRSNTGWPPQYLQEPPSPCFRCEGHENGQHSEQQYFSDNQAMKPTSVHNCYSCHAHPNQHDQRFTQATLKHSIMDFLPTAWGQQIALNQSAIQTEVQDNHINMPEFEQPPYGFHAHSNMLDKLPKQSYLAAPGIVVSALPFISRQQSPNLTRMPAGQEIIHLIDGTSVLRNSVIQAATLHETGLPARRRVPHGDMITPITLTTTARGDSFEKNWDSHRRARSRCEFDFGFGNASNLDNYRTEELDISKDNIPGKVLYVNMAPLSEGNAESSFHGTADEDRATLDNGVVPLTIGQALKSADAIHRAEKAADADTFYREVRNVDLRVLQNTLAEANFAGPNYFDEAFQGNLGP